MTTPRPYSIPVYKISLVRDAAEGIMERPQIRAAADAARVFRTYLGDCAAVESFLLAMLDNKNRIIGMLTVSSGALTAAVVHPRNVFQPALLHNCAQIIVAHNHPSGDPQPSNEDRALTARLVEGGKILGVAVLDHVILGDGTDRYFSFADAGLINRSI